MKKILSEYTESEFIQFLNEIFYENASPSDDRLNDLLDKFERITEYPHATDLIYYPDNDEDATPEKITNKIKEWRAQQGLSGFNKID